MNIQATVEKVLKTVAEDGKDVRKVNWTNKEVRTILLYHVASFFLSAFPSTFLFS